MTAVATAAGQPANPIFFAYDPGDIPAAGKAQSAMVVIGRDPMNAGYKPIRDAAVAGKIDLGVYLDMVLGNAAGQFHAPMLAGAKILGSGGNGWGRGVDIVNDSAHLDRCLAALDAIRVTVPGVKRIFADDFGPDNDTLYGTMSAAWRADCFTAYKAYTDAIEAWATKWNILVFYNGEWRGDRGHGYPVAKQSGNGKFAAMTGEHHDSNIIPGGYWYNQLTGTQGGLRDSAGHPMSIAICSTIASAQRIGAYAGIGYVCAQTDYAKAGPVVFVPHALSISFTGSPTPVPPPSVDPSPAPPARPAGPPPNLRIHVSEDGIVDYTWDPSPAPDMVDAYQAYVNQGTAENLVIPAGTTTYRLARTLPPGDYVGRVSAHNLAGYGPWTDPGVSFTVPAPPVTDPPPDDPCADVKAELDAASAARDQAVLDARAANVALDQANAKIAAARTALG